MSLKSNFKSDLKKEQALSILLDKVYSKKLKNYTHKRVNEYKQQIKGIDVIFTHNKSNKDFYIDEKAQLDYVNEDLPTFAFELSYLKDESEKIGWLFDEKKKTDFYALVTSIFLDSGEYTSCKITLVNRKKLIKKLTSLDLNFYTLKNYRTKNNHGRILLDKLNQKSEGYLFLSTKNKAERPLNLILKLDWLIKNKVAKRLN
jgi:hypothetical protein